MSPRARVESWLNHRWYGAGPVRWLLPLAALYGWISELRRRLYRRGWLSSYRSSLPVIVVGNLTVGGAGKTPFVLALVAALRARGWKPGVVSRGHGGGHRGAVLLPATPVPQLHGDEPSLIRRRAEVPVAVARRRADAAALIESAGGVDVLISDDGLQHYALRRDIEILVVDGLRRFGCEALLPAGPLREPVSRGDECDFRICNGGTPESGEWRMELRPSRLRGLVAGSVAPSEGSRVHAVAGIGNPSRFFRTLRDAGFEVQEHPFPDHHPFKPSDFDFSAGAPVVMTEKDAVKCVAFAQPNWFILGVDAELPEALFDALDAHLRRVSSKA